MKSDRLFDAKLASYSPVMLSILKAIIFCRLLLATNRKAMRKPLLAVKEA